MRERYRGNGGFSLVELLIVIAVIGILAATLLLSAKEFIERSKFVKTQSTIETLSLRVEQYNSERRQYPAAYGLVDDLMGKDRQGVPYYEFNADVLGGPGVRYKTVQIMDASTGTLSALPVPDGEFVLDAWDRPLYYIPNYQYDDPTFQIPAWNDANGNGLADANETYYNTASFQFWSAGPDGIVRGVQYGGRLIPAPMPFNDNRDNDGDGLIDREEDAEKATKDKPIGQNLPEDDIIR